MNRLYKPFCLFLLVLVTFNASAQRNIPKWKMEDLQQLIDSAQQPTIINFWASFCQPCLEEMPNFQKAANKYKNNGLRLVFVSLDLPEAYPKKINLVISKLKINSEVVFLDETNADAYVPFINKTWSGSIPATLFIDNKRVYKKFIEDELTLQKLEEEIHLLLDK